MSQREDVLKRLQQLIAEARELGDPDLLPEMRAVVERAAAASTPPRAVVERAAAASTPPRAVVERAAAASAPPPPAEEPQHGWHGILGRCSALLEMRSRIEKFAKVAAPVLIRGESGTGKDLVAHALHDLGPRAAAPFVSENCAAIPETLLESVLFGHVRGAFTGAVRDHEGHFVAAHKGTLFLDEIGDMPLAMQVKLLRVLQEGEVRPVGGGRVRKVDVRVVAATNQDLEAMVDDGTFRQDLFYRLNVLQLSLPPLRERGDDIIILARHFLARAAAPAGRTLRLDAAAEAALRAAPWPGNVRQLQNEMQRVAALCDGPTVGVGDLSI